MMKRLVWLLALAALCSHPAFAQAPNKVTAFARDALAKHRPGMMADAEKMPAEKYNLRGPPDEDSFGYLIWHIADGNYSFCGPIGGIPAPQLAPAAETDPKDRLVERMKSSFDFCENALAKLDDSHISENLDLGGNIKMSRAMAILTLSGSWAQHEQQLVTYLDLAALPSPK